MSGKWRGKLALLALTMALACALPPSTAVAHPTHGSTPNAVVAWNAIAADAALDSCLAPANNPLHESRMYAIMHIAIHDALNAIRHRARPYAFRGHAPGASPEAAVAAAARTTLLATLAELPQPFAGCRDTEEVVAAVEADYTAALAAIPRGRAKAKGIALGERSAHKILTQRADDGSNTPLFAFDFPDGDEPGEYRLTPGFDPRFAFAPRWGEVDTFALRYASQIPIEAPYAINSAAYTADYNEVKRLGGDGVTTPSARTAEETEIAQFWDESSPLLWNRLARQLAQERRLDLWQSARLFGLLDLALADGYIATFEAKYRLLFWRPVTAIQLGATDGNSATEGDPTWTPLRTTPPIPDHDSGHSIEGGAAAAVLRGFFGTDRMKFALCSYLAPAGRTCTDTSPLLRHYTSFSQAAAENARSRVLIGYHFTHATAVGTARGTKLGKLTVRKLPAASASALAVRGHASSRPAAEFHS